MNRRAQAFCTIVIGAAFVMIVVQSWQSVADLPTHHFKGVVALIVIALLSELLAVSAIVGTHKTPSSIAFIPLFACAILFPPPIAVLATIITIGVAQFFIHRNNSLRTVFNVSQAALSMAAANAVFESFGGSATPHVDSSVFIDAAPGLLGLAFTFFFLNQLSVSVIIALVNQERISTIFARMVAPVGSNLLYDILASPFAVAVALLYSKFGPFGVLFGILPLLIIRHSYASNAKLQQSNKDLLTVLVKTIETRDPYTSGHSVRVSILARAIAEDMDLTVSTVDRIETAALVHDIGKVDAVYASIIRKDGLLTEAERHVIVTHAAKGAEFLKTLTSFSTVVIEGVRHHHERYDGSGYPNGLSGDEIPLAARIIQLCDSIDAMLSDRPYRKALPIEHVRAELLRCAGTQFDPRIVEIILKRNTLERAAALVRPDSSVSKPQLVIASA